MTIVFVSGVPAPQGSKNWLGGKVMVESCKRLKPWRTDVREAFLKDGLPIADFGREPVKLTVEFIMPRTLSTPKTWVPPHTKKPDLSKLLRAIEDAITSAGIWHDDCQVIETFMKKRIASVGETTGCWIKIERIVYVKPVAPVRNKRKSQEGVK